MGTVDVVGEQARSRKILRETTNRRKLRRPSFKTGPDTRSGEAKRGEGQAKLLVEMGIFWACFVLMTTVVTGQEVTEATPTEAHTVTTSSIQGWLATLKHEVVLILAVYCLTLRFILHFKIDFDPYKLKFWLS